MAVVDVLRPDHRCGEADEDRWGCARREVEEEEEDEEEGSSEEPEWRRLIGLQAWHGAAPEAHSALGELGNWTGLVLGATVCAPKAQTLGRCED